MLSSYLINAKRERDKQLLAVAVLCSATTATIATKPHVAADSF